MKQTLLWFNLQRDGTRNGLPNIKETFAEILQQQMSVLPQRMSMSIFQSSRLVSQVHMMIGQNVKIKYLMFQNQIKLLKQHETPNSSLHNFIHQKDAEKLVKGDYWSYMCFATYLANAAVLNIRVFSRRYHFRL